MKKPSHRTIRRLWFQRLWLLPCLSVCLLTCGCFYRNHVYDNLRESRQDAYRRWLETHRQNDPAATRIAGKLSLQDALKLGLTHNKALSSAVAGQAVADGVTLASYGSFLPDVSVSGRYTRLDDSIAINMGAEKIPVQTLDNYAVDLEVTQPIFSGGAIPAAVRSGQISAVLSNEIVRAAVQHTIFTITNHYYQVLLAQHLHETFRAAVDSARAILDEKQKKKAQGMTTQYELLRAQVELSNFQAAMLEQKNAIDLGIAALLKAMGVSQESRITLSDVLAHQPMQVTFQAAMKLALENRPELYRAELEQSLQAEAVNMAWSSYFPQVFGFFTNSWGRPEPVLFGEANKWGDKWIAGLGFTLPIFDGLVREGKLVQEKGKLAQKEIQLKDTQEQVMLEVRQALKLLDNAALLVASQKLNMASAAEALRTVEAGHREGLNSTVELTDARAALTRARGLFFEALYKHACARLEVHRATGVLGPRADENPLPDTAADSSADTLVRPGEIPEFMEKEPAQK